MSTQPLAVSALAVLNFHLTCSAIGVTTGSSAASKRRSVEPVRDLDLGFLQGLGQRPQRGGVTMCP